MADVDISVYSNEDLAAPYLLRTKKPEFASVKKPTLEQTNPMDIEGATFVAKAKFGSRVVNLTVTVVDEEGASIIVSLSQVTLETLKNKVGAWDLLMVKAGLTDRLWGGKFEVLEGTS